MGILLSLLVLFAVFGTALIVGAWSFMLFKHKQRDKDRTTYILNFPTDLKHDQLTSWLRAISRTVSTSKWNLAGSESIVFETLSTDQGIIHKIKVPWQHKDDIIPQLRALAPGVTATPEEIPRRVPWTHAVEVGLHNPARTLDIPIPENLAASILAGMQPLTEGEAVLLQWVVAPARLEQLPHRASTSNEFRLGGTSQATEDQIKDRRAKLSEPNVMGVLRVAAKAGTPVRAEHLIGRVKTSLKPVENGTTYWSPSTNRKDVILTRVNNASSMAVWPVQLMVSELAALIAWPIGSPNVSGLPRGASRQLAANLAVPREGIVIGSSTFPGHERPVAISTEGGFQHTLITGSTGVGKTTLLANMVEQDMQQGNTVIVMEPKGDLFYETLARVPYNRRADVIIVDLNDTAFPVGFNVLQQGNPRLAAASIKSLFETMFPDIRRGAWARAALHRGLQTLITDPRTAFTDIVPLFSPTSRSDPETDWKDNLIRGLTDYDLKLFWQRFDNFKLDQQERYAAPLMDRAWIINETPEVRNIFGQSTSSFTFDDVVRNNKILLINLSGVPDDAASLTGTIFMQSLWTAVQALRGSAEKPAFLYLDEFQSFMKLPIATDEMLAKARSFRLGMRLAHQHLDQLTPELVSAVKSNARNKIMFNLNASDATVMAREYGSLVTPHDFQALRAYEAMAQVMSSEGSSQPFSMQTFPASRRSANVDALRIASRQQYGRPVDQVIQEMRDRRKGPEGPAKRVRPPISGADWE